MFYRKVNSFESWRLATRSLLRRAIGPQSVTWQSEVQESLFFEEGEEPLSDLPIKCEQPKIPRQFFQIAKSAAAFRDERKWSVLYRIAWRLVYEDKWLLNNKIDPDIAFLMNMRKAVGRDIHKMEAFVRFQRVGLESISSSFHSDTNSDCIPNGFSNDKENNIDNKEYFVSWFEPEHLILPLTAPFFIKRFTNMNWSILTPDGCAHWNQKQLKLTEGIDKGKVNIEKTDELESMWLVYYRNIFNPARLKLNAMQSEMPKKYWKNLPEAVLIKELTSQSTSMMEDMISDSQTDESVKTSKSKFIQQKQQDLRSRRLRASSDSDNEKGNIGKNKSV